MSSELLAAAGIMEPAKGSANIENLAAYCCAELLLDAAIKRLQDDIRLDRSPSYDGRGRGQRQDALRHATAAMCAISSR